MSRDEPVGDRQTAQRPQAETTGPEALEQHEASPLQEAFGNSSVRQIFGALAAASSTLGSGKGHGGDGDGDGDPDEGQSHDPLSGDAAHQLTPRLGDRRWTPPPPTVHAPPPPVLGPAPQPAPEHLAARRAQAEATAPRLPERRVSGLHHQLQPSGHTLSHDPLGWARGVRPYLGRTELGVVLGEVLVGRGGLVTAPGQSVATTALRVAALGTLALGHTLRTAGDTSGAHVLGHALAIELRARHGQLDRLELAHRQRSAQGRAADTVQPEGPRPDDLIRDPSSAVPLWDELLRVGSPQVQLGARLVRLAPPGDPDAILAAMRHVLGRTERDDLRSLLDAGRDLLEQLWIDVQRARARLAAGAALLLQLRDAWTHQPNLHQLHEELTRLDLRYDGIQSELVEQARAIARGKAQPEDVHRTLGQTTHTFLLTQSAATRPLARQTLALLPEGVELPSPPARPQTALTAALDDGLLSDALAHAPLDATPEAVLTRALLAEIAGVRGAGADQLRQVADWMRANGPVELTALADLVLVSRWLADPRLSPREVLSLVRPRLRAQTVRAEGLGNAALLAWSELTAAELLARLGAPRSVEVTAVRVAARLMRWGATGVGEVALRWAADEA